MALFGGMFGNGSGGMFDGLLPEMGGPGGYDRLTPEAEARLAEEARMAAAMTNGKKGVRAGGADMSLWQDPQAETLTQQMLRLNPFVGPQMAGAQAPQLPPGTQPQQPMPQVPADGTIAGGGPWMQPGAAQSSPNMPMSLAPPNPGAQYTPTPVFQDQASLPQNARPTQGAGMPQPQQQAQQMQPQGPDVGDRFGAGLQSFLHSSSPLSAIGNMLQGFQTGQRADAAGQAQNNQLTTARAIYQGLVANGHSPQQAMGIAQAAASNPEIAKAILPQALGPKEPPKTMEEFYARQAYAQQGKGGAQQVAQTAPGSAPAGSAPAVPGNYLDWLSAKKAAETKGDEQGKQAATLPSTLQRADDALASIEAVKNHPGKKYSVGVLGVVPGIPGTQQKDFVTRVDQLKGQNFLQAYQLLRGAGAITEIEGKKAENAQARLDRAQTPEAFDAALNDLETIVRNGRKNAGTLAGGAPTPAAPRAIQIAPGVTIRERH